MRWLVVLLPVLHLACGGGGAPRALGTLCTSTEQCDVRLTCLDTNAHFVAANDAGCTAGTIDGLKLCSLLCVSTDDCLAAGTAATCSFAGCANVGYCLPVSKP